jgi:hypothetical protein
MNGQQTPMNFQSPPSHQQTQQMHQDSGVSFSTPSQQDQSNMFNSPKDNGMVYQDSKMYSSPGQLHQLPNEQNMYHQSPLGQSTPGEEMNLSMFGTIDPNALGQQHQQR